jgi:ABC-type multidrug transport system fused ATPase/permease subunit
VLVDIALRLVNPQIVRMFLDTAQAGGPSSVLTTAAILFLIVGLAARAASLGASYAGLSLGWAATNGLREDLARHLLRLDMPFHKAHTPGELIERVDGDVTTLAEFFAEMLVRLVANLGLTAAILFLLYREDTAVGALLTVYLAVVIAALVLVNRVGVRAWTAAREAWAEQMGFLEERFAGTEDIRGIGAERRQQQRLAGLMLNLLLSARAGWLANALGHVISNFLFIVGYAIGLAVGASLYLSGQATIGTAFLIVAYIGMLATPIDALHDIAEQLQQATAGVNRVSELLALTPRARDDGRAELVAGPLSVELERVSFGYHDGDALAAEDAQPTDNLILRDVSFRLPAGRRLGVLGRTGSGKTTLTRLLLRLYDPDAGAIRLGGAEIREVPLAALRTAVGLVTQDVQLFGASVRENITLFDESVPDATIESALEKLGILDWARGLPQGLDTPPEPGGGGMSAGEAQLLAFARVLLRDPGLVILDEAASRLDPLTERRLDGAIEHLLGGGGARRTAIVIAHRLRTVQTADDILILEDGQVAEYGPRASLAADPDSRFSRLLRSGLEEALA